MEIPVQRRNIFYVLLFVVMPKQLISGIQLGGVKG